MTTQKEILKGLLLNFFVKWEKKGDSSRQSATLLLNVENIRYGLDTRYLDSLYSEIKWNYAYGPCFRHEPS